MTYWEFRQWYESIIPWWTPFASGLVFVIVFAIYLRGRK